ncbi:unnamed protein product, partial [Protopolystoma xenopodis]
RPKLIYGPWVGKPAFLYDLPKKNEWEEEEVPPDAEKGEGMSINFKHEKLGLGEHPEILTKDHEYDDKDDEFEFDEYLDIDFNDATKLRSEHRPDTFLGPMHTLMSAYPVVDRLIKEAVGLSYQLEPTSDENIQTPRTRPTLVPDRAAETSGPLKT